MPRKLKVYQTSQGFYDLAVAAPTMKAALKAWGASASPDLFRQGFAFQSDDKDVITAAMTQPGIVLRRPVGSNKPFREHAELPTAETLSQHFKRAELPHWTTAPKLKRTKERPERDAAVEAKRNTTAKADQEAERRAAAAFEKEERRRELQRQKEEAVAARARARRQTAIKKAQSALDSARREHNKKIAAIDRDRAAIEGRAREEGIRWQKLASRLEAALQKASR